MKLTMEEAIELMAKNDGNLDLRYTQIASLPDRLMVGGDLDLYGTPITSLPDSLTVGGDLDLRWTQITSLPDNLAVGGSLYLCGTPITSLPDNLTVGGGLDLRETQITSLPDSLTVGGSLDLRGTEITSLPDSLTVGYWLNWDETETEDDKVHYLTNGDYEEGNYLYADHILTHVKKRKQVGEYTVYVGKIKGRNVVSDGTYYAHCDDVRDGIKDICFKKAKDRGAEQYKHLTLDSEIKTEEAIAMYRIITGACRQGTESFLNRLGELKESYTVEEIIKLTEGQYGAKEFKDFFR